MKYFRKYLVMKCLHVGIYWVDWYVGHSGHSTWINFSKKALSLGVGGRGSL